MSKMSERDQVSSVKWVHFSDLHFKYDDYNTTTMRRSLKEYIKNYSEKYGCFDYVVITGDICHQGEYDKETVTFVSELIKLTGCQSKNVIIAPGNHDATRFRERKEILDNVINRYHHEDNKNLKIPATYRDILLTQPFLEYNRLYNEIKLEPPPLTLHHVIKDDDKITFIVLNTAVFSGQTYTEHNRIEGDDEKNNKNLLICDQEFLILANDNNPNKLNVVIGHHAVDCFDEDSEQQKFKNALDRLYADLYLCGHVHKSLLDPIKDTYFEQKQVACGGLFNGSSNQPSFVTGEFNPTTGTVTLTSHAYTQRNENWVISNDAPKPYDNGYYKYVPKRLALPVPGSKTRATRPDSDVQSDKFYDAISQYYIKNNTFTSIFKDESVGHNPTFETVLEIDGKPVSLKNALNDLKKGQNTLLIYGDGGAGKTFILLKTVNSLHTTKNSARHILYIPLNELKYEKDDINKENYLEKYLKASIFDDLNWKQHYSIQSNIELLLFLDGFNETPVEKRHALAKEIKKLSSELNCKIVIASRYEDVLTNMVAFGKKASVKELTEPEIQSYLDSVNYSLPLVSGSHLTKLLMNPLILTLFGKTSKFQNLDCLEKQYLCKWIDINNNNVSESKILWNYLNCDILKINETEEREKIFLAWVSVRFFWPKLAFHMQKNSSYIFSKEEMVEQIEHTLEWLKQNIETHTELKRVNMASVILHFEFKNFILSLNSRDIYYCMFSNQAFFGGKADKFKFFHQSIRDCLAAIHLINIAPTEIAPFPIEWAEKNLFRNIYMLRHFSELGQSENQSVLRASTDCLRGKEIPLANFVLNNLLTAWHRILNGDFSGFDFSRLDLQNCELTEFTLSKKGRGATFTGAKIGINTFLRDSHHKPVSSIAISEDGTYILTTGNDKVLRWNFRDRTVDREIYRYHDFNEADNQCCFSKDKHVVLFTNGHLLLSYNIDSSQYNQYSGAIQQITSLTATVDGEHYLARDSTGNNYCWHKEKGHLKYKIEPTQDEWIHYTPIYNQFLIYDKNKRQLNIVDEHRKAIQIVHSNLPNISICAITEKLCALTYQNDPSHYNIFVFDLYNPKNQTTITTDSTPVALSIAPSGRWLCASVTAGNNKGIKFFQKNDTEFTYSEKASTSLYNQNFMFSSLTLYENYVFCGTTTGIIQVNAVFKGDHRYYGITALDNHSPYVEDIVLKPGTNCCIAAYEDGVLREWDYITGTSFPYKFGKYHKMPIRCVAVANNKKLIASGGEDGRILLWDSESPAFPREVDDLSKHILDSWDIDSHTVRDIIFTHDDCHIIASCNEGLLFVWNIEQQNEQEKAEQNNYSKPIICKHHEKNVVKCILYYRFNEEDRLVSADKNGNLFFWKLDLAKNSKKGFIPKNLVNNAHKDRVRSIALSPDSRYVISYGEDNKIREWDADTGAPIRSFHRQSSSPFDKNFAESICYSPNGQTDILYANTKQKNVVHIMELNLSTKKAKTKKTHNTHVYGPNQCCIAVGDKSVLSSANDGIIKVYDNREKDLQQMIAFAPVSKKVKDCKGLDSENTTYIPSWLRDQFVPKPLVSPIQGKFEKWLREGIFANIFQFIREYREASDEILVLCPELKKCGSVDDCIKTLVQSLIACTNGQTANIDSDYALLEAIVSYLYYEAPDEEQNLLMVVYCLVAESNVSDDDNDESDLELLFSHLKSKKPQHQSVIRYFKSYKERFGHNRETVISLLKRLSPLFPIYVSDATPLQLISADDIHKLSVAIVMSFNPEWSCPDYFDDTAKAQVTFLERVFQYLNDLPESERTMYKLRQLLQIFESPIDEKICQTFVSKVPEFSTAVSNVKTLTEANKKISACITCYDTVKEVMKQDADEVNTIEVYDELGESVQFEHLDTIEMNGAKYVVMTPFNKEVEEGDELESDVYIMLVATNENGEEVLKMIEDGNIIEKVYQQFKLRSGSDYEFI